VKNDPRYVDTSPCVKWNSKGHVYAIANDINTGRLNVGCHVKLVAMSSASSLLENFFSDNTSQTLSYAEIHGILSYGFDLTWVRRACDDFCDTKQDCQLNREIGKLECYLDYCSTPLGNFVNCGKEESLFILTNVFFKDFPILYMFRSLCILY
jgi:hypothetical protein